MAAKLILQPPQGGKIDLLTIYYRTCQDTFKEHAQKQYLNTQMLTSFVLLFSSGEPV